MSVNQCGGNEAFHDNFYASKTNFILTEFSNVISHLSGVYLGGVRVLEYPPPVHLIINS